MATLARAIDPNIAQWDVAKKSVAGVADDFGDKYSDVVATSFGNALYTGGPVKDANGKVVGAILVGMPLTDVMQRISRQVVANMTIYGPDGRPLGTTLDVPASDTTTLTLDSATFQKATALNSQVTVQRKLLIGQADYLELLGQLFVGHNKVAGALGVEVPTPAIAQANDQTRTRLVLIFSGVLVAVIIVGRVTGRVITKPIFILVKACQLVAAGDREQQVNIKNTDETGVLAHSFNTMVGGLKERDFIKDTFGKYMSEAVSDAILSGDLKLGGERKHVTVLISHIHSFGGKPFAALYEAMGPEEMVAYLNGYFHAMTSCIARYDGIVDKFVGEEILAVFGAPIAHEDDASRAVLAALDMRKQLVDFNNTMAERGIAPIRIGIGLYSGPVVSGNIGSEVRMEYTVIGDTVNSTARTEEMTKSCQTDLLIGDTTYELVKDHIDVARPHVITLRGRTQQSSLYPVLGLKEGFEQSLGREGSILSRQETDSSMSGAQLALT